MGDGDAQLGASCVGVGECTVGVPRFCVSMPRIGDPSPSLSFFDFSVILNIPLRFRNDEECPSGFGRCAGSLLVIVGGAL